MAVIAKRAAMQQILLLGGPDALVHGRNDGGARSVPFHWIGFRKAACLVASKNKS